MFSLDKIPKRKCGAEVIVGGILGGAGLLGSALATSSATRSQEDQNALNRAYNSAESQKAREWSTNERLAAQKYNTSEREAAQRYQTASVPQNIASSISALRSSGVNANVIGSSAINSGASGSSGQSAPIGSGGQASFGTGVNPQVMQIPQLISSGAEMVNALSKNKETRASLPLIDSQVKNWLLKNAGEQTTNELLQLEKKLKESTLPANIKKSFEELAKLGFEKVAAKQLGVKYEKDAALADIESKVQKQVEKLTGENAIVANYLRMNWHRQFESMLRLQSAQTKESLSSADQHSASARDLNASAEGRELLNNISRATNLTDIDNAIFNSSTITFLQQSSNKEQLYQQLERDIKNSSGYKNSENRKRVDASLENLRRILGINVSVGASASN